MNQEEIQNILKMSQTFASGKRLLLLFILRERPMGYTEIVKAFQSMGIQIGSSEVYKHLNYLLREEFIVKSTRSYILTLKGFKTTENTMEIIKTPAIIPELEFSFRRNK